MRLCLVLSIALSFTACKKDQDKPAEPAPAPVAPSPTPAPAPAPTPAPAPAPAPAAEFTGDVKAFIAGTVAGYDAATQELAVYVQIVGDEEFVAIRRYQVSATGPSTVGGDVRLAKSDEAVVKSALAGLAAVTGTPLTKPARLDGGAVVAFDTRTKQLTVRIDGKADTRKLDGGGVTTPTPRTAFAVPGTKLVAVSVEYIGDVVRTHDLEVFGGAAAAAGDDPMEKAAMDRLEADAKCKSGDRKDCDGDGVRFGDDKDDNDAKVK